MGHKKDELREYLPHVIKEVRRYLGENEPCNTSMAGEGVYREGRSAYRSYLDQLRNSLEIVWGYHINLPPQPSIAPSSIG